MSIAKKNISQPSVSCSEAFRHSGLMLQATAPQARVWVLLEFPDPWGARAVTDSGLPARIQEQLDDLSNQLPDVRVLLIRRHDRRKVQQPLLYLAFCDIRDPLLYCVTLGNYQQLTELPLIDICQNPQSIDRFRSDEPLMLVCTNGKRDRCCARLGLVAYRKLSAEFSANVWQCSHLGGHRFAPTMLQLPDGWCYGAIPDEQLEKVAGDSLNHEIHWRFCRGNVTQTPEVQAADYYLRDYLRKSDARALIIIETRVVDDSTWKIEIKETFSATHYVVTIAGEVSSSPQMIGCTSGKSKPVWQYHLVNIKQQPLP